MKAIIHRLILWVRNLRNIPFFKVTTRIMVITSMVLGTWVATKTLDLPESFATNDKLIHMVVFFGFSFLMDLATSRHPFWLWKGLPLLIYGIIIEVMQYFSPNRTFSVLDWAADLSGILLYFLAKMFLIWIDSKRSINSKY